MITTFKSIKNQMALYLRQLNIITMEITTTIIRILLGIVMIVFSMNAMFIKAFKPAMVENGFFRLKYRKYY